MKIGDFGLATEYKNQKKNEMSQILDYSMHITNTQNSFKISSQVGTPMYFSPEQKEGSSCTQKVDIWAMGLILYEMCSTFRTGMERILNLDKLKNEHLINETVANKFPEESKLIQLMTNRRAQDRPTAQEILDSDILKEWKNQVE